MTAIIKTPKSWRATKILATLGSASESKEKITEMVQAGVNIVRINFSHGTHKEHLTRINHVRAVENAHQKCWKVLCTDYKVVLSSQ